MTTIRKYHARWLLRHLDAIIIEEHRLRQDVALPVRCTGRGICDVEVKIGTKP